MKQIPFTVSARTARLIGRENVSNADGAILELIKNSYDADAAVCIIFIDNKYEDVPQKLSFEEYSRLMSQRDGDDAYLMNKAFVLSAECYNLSHSLTSEDMETLSNYFRKQIRLFIIDNGIGMTDKIIEQYWMTIGTDNKQVKAVTERGRVKAGAKGIGRFALDRLANQCKLWTLSNETQFGYKWEVVWSDFEKKGKTIDNIYAILDEKPTLDLSEMVNELVGSVNQVTDCVRKHTFDTGTIIELSNLRDYWDDESISNLFTNLELLVPPEEENDFELYMVCSKTPNLYGKVASFALEDYDYKLSADIDTLNDNVVVKISRREFDMHAIDQELFLDDKMKMFPFDQTTFEKGEYQREISLRSLLASNDYQQLPVDQIGRFSFSLYFLKQSYNKNERERFFYRDFNAANRKQWMASFGGVRLFRDNFRVRPYGEGSSFDWLMLGERAAKSPAGVTHKSGQWRVRPNQVSGIIHISRLNNISFEDKSSREGLQENKEFITFKLIVEKVISEFERDRQTVMRAMERLYTRKNTSGVTREQALDIAEKIVKETSKKSRNNGESFSDREILALRLVESDKQNQELISELKMVRGLASTGLVITSFAHELKNLSARIVPRTGELREIISELVSQDEINSLAEEDNPMLILDDFYNQDIRLKHWLDFTLNAVRKDKRMRRKEDLFSVFEEFAKSWHAALSIHGVQLHVPESTHQKCLMRIFMVDFDSIFNNLIANSIDAFQRRDATSRREIYVNLGLENGRLFVDYEDSGPGLVADITNPAVIFDSFYSTKRDALGRQTGTGLGMWIVKTTVEEYKGDISLIQVRGSFKIRITFPLRKDEGFANG